MQHDLLPYYSTAMLWFVIPLTVLTVLTLLFRERRSPATAP
jgi:hypothetical protein